MNNKTKRNLFLIAAGVFLLALFFKPSVFTGLFDLLLELTLPIIAGCILALFMTVPMNGIKKLLVRIFRKAKKKPSEKVLHISSFAITVVCVATVLALVLILLVPELISSTQTLYEKIEEKIAEIRDAEFEAEWLNKLIADIDWDEIVKKISANANKIVGVIVSSLSSAVNIAVTALFALIISVYVALGREKLGRHAKKLVLAYVKPSWAKKFFRFCRMFSESFSKFLSGQCTEALILGFLMSVSFLIFRLPYAWLAGILTAVCALVPYVGAIISCALIALLTLVTDPSLAIRCVIVYLVIQFIENQFIYPKVVGESVGLPPVYTLIAALVGGNLFGVIGIIFSVPLTAVIVELVKENTAKRLKEKETELKDNDLL